MPIGRGIFLKVMACVLGGLIGAAVTLEVVFRLLPVSTATATGYYSDPMILTYPANHRFTVATGWNLKNSHTHQANNYGFLAARDFKLDPTAVAVIGDSFVEASMLDVRDQLGSQLEAYVDGRPVYSLGGPGSALLDYAERIRFASETFAIRDFVVLLENGDVGQSLCGSGNIHAPCLNEGTLAPMIERQPTASWLKRAIRHLALPQYFFSQLKIAPADLSPTSWLKKLGVSHQTAPSTTNRRDALAANSDATQRVIDEFFARIKPYPIDRLILVPIGADRSTSAIPDTARQQLLATASRRGALVLQAAPLLDRYTKESGLSMQVSPHDGHLNPLALELVAKELAKLL